LRPGQETALGVEHRNARQPFPVAEAFHDFPQAFRGALLNQRRDRLLKSLCQKPRAPLHLVAHLVAFLPHLEKGRERRDRPHGYHQRYDQPQGHFHGKLLRRK
jgi:hypothetical protein